MIIRFTNSDHAHAVAEVLESVGVPCEVYPVDVSEARPWFVDLSDAVAARREEAERDERRRLYTETFTGELPLTLMTSTEIQSLSVDPTRSDLADHTHEESKA